MYRAIKVSVLTKVTNSIFTFWQKRVIMHSVKFTVTTKLFDNVTQESVQ